MWSAAFSRNLEAEFEILVGVYSSKRCKSLWTATGLTCHAALCSAEIPGGRSGPSVWKKDLWERRKGSRCQISPFFPPLWGIHPAPMTSDLISSDVFFSPASLHTTTHPSVLLCASSRFQHQPESNMHQFFSRTALTLQCFWHHRFLCHIALKVLNIFGHSPSFSWLEHRNIT